MRGVNKAVLLGRIGQDPESRYMPSGAMVVELSLATSEQWKDKQSGEKQERTEWHKVVFFGRLAEIAAEYLRKGSLVYVEGTIQTDKWKDREGNDRYTTKIKAREMQMLGGGDKAKDKSASAPPAKKGSTEDFEDNIPF